jgi:hypothetical protein
VCFSQGRPPLFFGGTCSVPFHCTKAKQASGEVLFWLCRQVSGSFRFAPLRPFASGHEQNWLLITSLCHSGCYGKVYCCGFAEALWKRCWKVAGVVTGLVLKADQKLDSNKVIIIIT